MDNGADKCNLVRYTCKKLNEKISSNGSKKRKTLLLFTLETNYFSVQMQNTRQNDLILFMTELSVVVLGGKKSFT